MQKKFSLANQAKRQLENKLREILLQKREILFAYIHGSFLQDIPFHDIDLALYMDESQINKQKSLDYELRLSIELELKVKYPIDVKIINFAPLYFRYTITKGKLLLSNDDELRYNFIEKTWLEYLDFKPYYYETLKFLYNIG